MTTLTPTPGECSRGATNASTPIPWREEPVHQVLLEDSCVTLYSAAAPPAAPDADIVWHSHALDTIFVMLCTAEAVSENPGSDNARITTTRGGVLVYRLTGRQPYVHRVRDHSCPLAFFGVEVSLQRLPEDEEHLTVCSEVAEPLTTEAGFATASRVSIEPHVPFSLLRGNGPGFLPMRTVFVATDATSQLKHLQVFHSPSASVCRVEDRRLGFYMAALLIKNAGGGAFGGDAGCVLLNSGDSTWEGVVIDVWGRRPKNETR